MTNLSSFKKSLHKYKSIERARINSSFFKTGKGEYGEGDVFLGITVPNIRKVLKEFSGKLIIDDAMELLQSKYHEERLAGVLLLVLIYKIGNEKEKKIIFDLYLENTNRINNWDIVDSSAPQIVGGYLCWQGRTLPRIANGKVRPCQQTSRVILHKLAKSKSLWERRIAIVSTFTFIKNKEYVDCFKLCEILINDKEDLIHKACGWMLREVGKNCGQNILDKFLNKHASVMPRTMLRYALEKHIEEYRRRMMDKGLRIK